MRCLLLNSADAQRGVVAGPAKFDAEWPLRDNSYTERFECLAEKRLAPLIVADPEHNVIKHEFS
jgi:hypothetical protein